MNAPMTACEWRVGEAGLDELRIVERAHPFHGIRYAVTWRGRVANTDDEWEFEPQPSSRDDDFYNRTRWENWSDAAAVAQRMHRSLPTNNDRSGRNPGERHG